MRSFHVHVENTAGRCRFAALLCYEGCAKRAVNALGVQSTHVVHVVSLRHHAKSPFPSAAEQNERFGGR